MKITVLIVIGFLFEVHRSAHGIIQEEIFVVDDFTECNSQTPTKNESIVDKYEKAAQECYKGCFNVIEQFPHETLKLGKSVVSTFKTHIDELQILTNSNSTIISSGSVGSLKAISFLSKLGKSPVYLLHQFKLSLHKFISSYKDVVSNLWAVIRKLVTDVNDILSKVHHSIDQVLKQFEKRKDERKLQRCEKIEIEQMMNDARHFVSTVALIAETALEDSDGLKYTNGVFHGLLILTLIANNILTSIQGASVNIGTERLRVSKDLCPLQKSSFEALDPWLTGMARFVASIRIIDSQKSTQRFLESFVKLTTKLNKDLAVFLGPYKGVNITTKYIKKNLARSRRN